MQDFDAGVVDTDRQFRIAGQTYTVRKRVRPEVLALLGEFDAAPDNFKHTIEQLDVMILAVLTRESAERWHAMRTADDDDGENTVDLEGMNAVLGFAIEAATKRPLGSVESSTTGTSPIEPTSPVPSSSLAAVPSTG